MLGERLRQPSDAAPEIERAIRVDRKTETRQIAQHVRDFVDAGSEEVVEVPFSAVLRRVREDGPQRIDPGVGVP
jgi:hypothetical protein